MNPMINELKNYLLYANSSPVSYFLNGFNSAIILIGNKSSCKSRLLFSSDIAKDIASDRSIFGNMAQEIIRYTENQNISKPGNHPAFSLGISIADVTYSDLDKTEILLDLLRVKDNNNKNADIDMLSNVQIT